MSTPTGSPEEPIDDSVRTFFWRLRARLVTPPAEDRVEADLDRLIGAARIRAHVAPSAGAGPRPWDELESVPVYAAVEATVPVGQGTPLPPAVAIDNLRALRRHRLTGAALSRAAAAVLLVVGVGTGVNELRAGTVAFDLRTDDGDLDPPVAASDDQDTDVREAGDGTATGNADGGFDTPRSDDDVIVALPFEAGSGTGGDASATDRAPRTSTPDTTPQAPAPAPSGPAPSPSPSPSPVPSPTPSPPPAEGGPDGFGGARPCDSPDLADCVDPPPDDEVCEDPDATDDAAADPDDDDDAAADGCDDAPQPDDDDDDGQGEADTVDGDGQDGGDDATDPAEGRRGSLPPTDSAVRVPRSGR